MSGAVMAAQHQRSRRSVAALLALALVAIGWPTAAAGASVDGPTDTELVTVGVFIDDNGPLPGGGRVERFSVPAHQVAATIDRLEELDAVRVASSGHPISIASDPLRPQQYGTNRVRANLLPDHITGVGATVAVIDTGVSGAHPDLQGTLPDGRPRVATGITYLTMHPQLEGLPGNVDPHGHGTHAAGIIAAERGNGVGIAGLAPAAQILPVRALDATGSGLTIDVADGVLFAHDAGADVINLSLAGPHHDPLLSSAIQYVTSDWSRGKPPSVVVAAAGNAGASSPRMFPAAYSRTIAVAASNANDRIASFSTRGSYVDVAAPGASIVSTWPTGRSCSSAPASGYCSLNGTSMAAPYVAAVAALLRSQEPGLSPAAVRKRIESTAHDIATLGRDDASGVGRVDAAAAVLPGSFTKVPRVHSPPQGTLASVEVDGRRITVRGTATDREGPPKVRVRSTLNGRTSVRTVTAGAAPRGNWTLEWNDAAGTHRVCVDVLDNPFGTATSLGCRDAVVK